MKEKSIDNLFAHPMGKVPGFTFDESVAAVFPDMISRSVPGYSTVVAICGVLAKQFSQPGSRLYDLGCSLGAGSFSMASEAAEGCQIIATDNSPAMLEQFAQQLAVNKTATPIELVCDDITRMPLDDASVVALNYTLQFIDIARRDALLDKIYCGMREGGALILSEKVEFEDVEVDKLFIDLHHRFKAANGYSQMEISQKRDAIDNVLIPETIATHKKRLSDSGFSRVEMWFQCFNFVSLVAIK